MTISEAESRRLEIKARRDLAEERLLDDTRPKLIPVEGGEPMVWTEHDEEDDPGGRIQ